MKAWTICKAHTADAEAIADILQTMGWFAHLNSQAPEPVIKQVEQQMLRCHADNSHSIYVANLVATHDASNVSRALGYIAVHWLPYLFLPSPEGYVSELFVHKDYRGQGIGTALLDAVVAEASDRGCSRLMLVNSKDRDSYQRQFYVKQGWRERENVANFVYSL